MANSTRRANLKGIEESMTEYKAKHGEFQAGETYIIEYANGWDETRECVADVDAGSSDPESDILDIWDDYLEDDAREYCCEDLETASCVTGIYKAGE